MIDDPEEEAWMELARKQTDKSIPRLERPARVKSFDDAFEDYLSNMGGSRTASNEEVRRHFSAGWVAGIRNEWAKERND